MGGQEHSSGKAPFPRRRLGKWIAGAIGTIILAAVVAFASNLGTKAAEDIGKGGLGPPITYSVAAKTTECFAGTFLPSEIANEVLEKKPPLDWRLIENQFGAVPVGRDPVEVDIQGESERKVTLIGIEFHVHKLRRPRGMVFYDPCGGPTIGRSLEVDLDATPPRVVASSSEVEGMPTTKPYPRLHMRPIRFPWTVSLTDPLLLEISANTKHCYCTWTADIPWVSGSMRGVIHIDDEGKGFTVADDAGLVSYGRFSGNWQRSAF